MTEAINTVKTVGNVALGLVLALMNGIVAAGDRIVAIATALLSNEFFLMLATIVGFVVLMK